MALPADTTNSEWYYLDRTGQEFGPFRNDLMRTWYTQGLFKVGDQLLVRLDEWTHYVPLRQLYADGDAFISGKSKDQEAAREAGSERGDSRRAGSSPAATPAAVLTPAHANGSANHPSGPRNRSSSPGSASNMAGAGRGRENSRSRSARGRARSRDRESSPGGREAGHGSNPYGSHPSTPYGASPYGAAYPGYGHHPPPGYGPHPYSAPPPGYGHPGYYGAPPPHPAYGHPQVIYAYGPPPAGAYQYGGYSYAYGPPPAPGGGDTPGRYYGRIKSFNTKNGFGFIDCPAANTKYKRDVFVHKKWMSDLQVGEDISFLIETNKEGMPQARDVARTDGRPPLPSAEGESRGRRPVELKRRGESNGQPPAKRQAITDGTSTPQPKRKKQSSIPDEERTTLMLKNLPDNCSRADLLKALSGESLQEACDFVYLPTSFRTWKCCGYAFVNLTSHEAAERAMKALQGYEGLGARPGQRGLEAVWSVLQGLDHHVERYRNSPVMHEEVPDECRPLHLSGGAPVPFPAPTKRLKAPRLRLVTGSEKGKGESVAGDDAADGSAEAEADFEAEDADAAEAEAAEADAADAAEAAEAAAEAEGAADAAEDEKADAVSDGAKGEDEKSGKAKVDEGDPSN